MSLPKGEFHKWLENEIHECSTKCSMLVVRKQRVRAEKRVGYTSALRSLEREHSTAIGRMVVLREIRTALKKGELTIPKEEVK